MFFKYVKEREGLEKLESEMGFLTYKFRGVDCYIKDIYVLPEHRKKNVASIMADKVAEIAKAAGVHILTGSIDSRAGGAEASEKVLISYGMKPYTKEGFVTYYAKEI